MKPQSTDNPAREGAVRSSSREPGAVQTVVALFRTRSRRCRLAAAFVAVMVGLVGQTATQAFAQARETILYLDAPAVSTDRATRAGETASAYSDPRSPASPDALAWLRVQGPRGEAPPQAASVAFASITAPDTEGKPGITAEAAYDAGATMLAQIEDGAPSEDGGPGEDELATAGAVRPELGDGTQAPEEEPSAGYEAPPAEQPTTPDLASSPEPVVPAQEPVAEPSGGEGLTLEAPASAPAETELAVAPTEDASPSPEVSLDPQPDYGAAGPISEPAAETPTEPSTEPATEPATEPSTEAAVEPAAEPAVQPVEEPEDGSGELAGVETTPASPAPEEAGQDDGSDGEVSEEQVSEVVVVQESDTGEGGEAEASAPPDFAPSGGGAESGPAEGVGSPPWAGGSGTEADPETQRAPDTAAAPPPELAPVEAPPAEESADSGGTPADGTPAPELDLGDDPDSHSGPDVAPGSESGSDTVSSSPTGKPTGKPTGEPTPAPPSEDTEKPAPDDPHGAGPSDEGTVGDPSGCGDLLHAPEDINCDGVPDSPPSEEAPPESGDKDGGQDATQGAGPGEGPGEDLPFPDGDPHGPPETVEREPAPSGDRAPNPTDDAGTDDPRPEENASEENAPAGGSAGSSEQRPDRPGHDHRDDQRYRNDRNDRGRSGATSPDERVRRIKESDGGAEAVQEKAQESTGRSGSGGEQQSVTQFEEERSSGGGRSPELPASIAPRADDGSARRKSAQDGPPNVLQNPTLDLDRLNAGTPGAVGHAGKEPAAREHRSRETAVANLEDAEEESSEGSRAGNYLIRTTDPAQEDAAGFRGDRMNSANAEEPSPSTTSPERHTAGGPYPDETDTGPVASQPASQEASATPTQRPAKENDNTRRTPPVWDRQGVPPDTGARAAAERAESDRRARADRLAERQAAECAERRDARRASRQAAAEQAARQEARQERAAYRRQVAREEAAAARSAERRADRREARQAEIFTARAAEREAERKAGRVAARQADRQAAREQAAVDQSAVERAALRDQRRQSRLASGKAFDAQAQAAPSAGLRWNPPANAPAYQEPVAQPAAAELAPVRQERAQRFDPVEQPAQVQLPPARQVPSARLDPAPQVQPQQQFGVGGAGASPGGGGGVAGMTKSGNRSIGQ